MNTAAHTVDAILAATQINAAKMITADHRNDLLTVATLQQVAEAEGRKHVVRTIARVAAKMGFASIDILMGDAPAVETSFDDEPMTDAVAPSFADLNPALAEEIAANDTGFAAAIQAPIEATVAPTKDRVQRPDFASVDWDLAPVKSSVGDTCDCPKCGKSASGEDEIAELFGTRNTKRWTAREGAFIVEIAQSFCRGCRSTHAKERRAAKKAAAATTEA